MARRRPANSNKLVENQLDSYAKTLEKALDSDVLTYLGPIGNGADDEIRDAVEARSSRRPKLSVILETGGGYIEVTQRIADTFRHHYSIVDFVIPNHAMSAGTVLAMSGDAIWMDYYSVLGPIDPQLPRSDGRGMVPALGYLEYYERLIEKGRNNQLTTAEMHFLISKFDPAELYQYEQARRLSIALLETWLAKYKFKDWVETEGRGISVDDAMRTARAKEIAEKLNSTERWCSHGRGIPMQVLRDELNLKVDDLEENPDVYSKTKEYYNFLVDYLARRGHSSVLHSPGRFRWLG